MHYFFDTSALQHRYVDSPKSRSIRKIISDKRNRCYISELTILEISSALALRCRKAKLTLKDYSKMDQSFWRDIHEQRLHVRPVTQRDMMKARHLLRYAGVELNRKLKSADALIAASALEDAYESGMKVTFCLEDWTLYDVVRNISAYRSALRFRYIGVDKANSSGTSKGAASSST